ncbi:KELT protein [Plasmodium ovale curtisi]|nr:KELT protein [Plasmodium ovale curtisi]SBS99546.1 KELT protein [Plasmodium ovale curtisi]
MSLAERESAHELKGSDTKEEFDEESFNTPLSLLSISYSGKVEDAKLEELENLGAVGGIDEMEELESVCSDESEDEYRRTRRNYRKRIASSNLKEYAEAYTSFPSSFTIEKKENKDKTEESSSSSVYETPYESSTDIDEEVLELFVESIYRTNALLPTVSASLIQLYLKAGISGEERISKLNNDYPLNRSKKIDFKNLRSPFGTEVKCLKDLDEEQLNDALFFDDFFVCSLSNFLKNTKVGKFYLSEVCTFYKAGFIRFFPCSVELLEYLTLLFPLFDINYFLYKNMVIYIGRSHNYIWNFGHRKIPLIRKHTTKDKFTLEQLKMDSTYRHITFDEIQELECMIENGKRNISELRKIFKKIDKKMEKINDDLKTLLYFFPMNLNYLCREECIITCIHYILTFCNQLIKPLYDKSQSNEQNDYKIFSNVSSTLNTIMNLLEMLEFNSELYNIFCTYYPEFDNFYPRLNSVEEITIIYNYFLVKLQYTAVIFDICKSLLKLHGSRHIIKYYKEYAFVSYRKVLSDVIEVLEDSERVIQELT